MRRGVRSDRSASRGRAGVPWSLCVRAILSTVAVVAGTLGCSGDTTGPPPVPVVQAYWALQLNQHAVNLALTPPYDTVQLTAVPINVAGTALSGVGPVTYTPADSTVSVTSAGVVTARYQTTETFVVAHLQAQGVTLADTVFLQVTPTPPPSALATFSMQPARGDSAKRALDFDVVDYNNGFPWSITAIDKAGDTVCDGHSCAYLVDYRSSNPSVASIDRLSGTVGIAGTGHVVFTATTLAYGKVWRDSVLFVIGYALNQTITILPATVNGKSVLSFQPALIVGVGATITWSNSQASYGTNADGSPSASIPHGLDSIDVVFDDSLAELPAGQSFFGGFVTVPPMGGGNIPPFGFDSASWALAVNGEGSVPLYSSIYQARSFPIAGTYPYHSRLYGTTGEIIVRKD
ncbi:MAG TPA: hypothetical protein VNU46_01130 [Gemmatimonadaceae bacterium]|nr:hypothetical protein [Gemmatimonadaceae bacterium]